jgi:hypothetical protein
MNHIFAFQVFARNWGRCNFRLLQHNQRNSRRGQGATRLPANDPTETLADNASEISDASDNSESRPLLRPFPLSFVR